MTRRKQTTKAKIKNFDSVGLWILFKFFNEPKYKTGRDKEINKTKHTYYKRNKSNKTKAKGRRQMIIGKTRRMWSKASR